MAQQNDQTVHHRIGRQASIAAALVIATTAALAQTKPVETIAREIRDATLTLPAQRPLPLAASFMTGEPNAPGYTTPEYQLGPNGWLKRGYHFLPTFLMPGPDPDPAWRIGTPRLDDNHYRSGMAEAARLGLPLVFYGTQWELLLLNQPEVDANQDAIRKTINGTTYLMPGTMRESEWYEAGRKWGASVIPPFRQRER